MPFSLRSMTMPRFAFFHFSQQVLSPFGDHPGAIGQRSDRFELDKACFRYAGAYFYHSEGLAFSMVIVRSSGGSFIGMLPGRRFIGMLPRMGRFIGQQEQVRPVSFNNHAFLRECQYLGFISDNTSL